MWNHAGATFVTVDTSDSSYKRLQHPSTESEHARNLPQSATLVVYTVSPNVADPSVKRFLRDSYAMFDRARSTPASKLFLYLVGTHGDPDDAKLLPLTAVSQGYRTINLMYNDVPATSQACDRDPDPACSEHFRQKRVYGDDTTHDIDDVPNESVMSRLTALLRYLEKNHAADGWGGYLLPDGSPNWKRMVLSGHSQGAGIAAFIAKKHEVDRVILFSSPWDHYYTAPHHQKLAPWIEWTSATPAERWWGMYHTAEPTAKLIQMAYEQLGMPASHIKPVSLAPRNGGEPHTSVSGDTSSPRDDHGDPVYRKDWVEMIGDGAGQ